MQSALVSQRARLGPFPRSVRSRQQMRSISCKSSVSEDIKSKIARVTGGDPAHITPQDLYQGAAHSVRDELFDEFNNTNKYFDEKDPKFVYYLSAEFLMGRSLLNAVYNLGVKDQYAEAIKELGYDLETAISNERDASLGNGGLGRLAACFLDSMATLSLPGWGYGIRYRYGMFKQALDSELKQQELPDVWLTNGNPWELAKPIYHTVKFGGSCIKGTWKPKFSVKARAYDNPIPGWKTRNCGNLRLWDAVPEAELDLDAFNSGRYVESVEAKRKADAIVSVLYPNDATPEGKLLRLEQQYFFVSASIQDVLARFKAKHGTNWDLLPDKAIFQMNDTHPTIAVAELIRILVDDEKVAWDKAKDIARKSLAFTNHTVMPEALERWPFEVMAELLPRHAQIIERLDLEWNEFLRERFAGEADLEERVARMSIIQPNQWNQDEILINMAYLALIHSSYVNGVAAIHSNIIKDELFKEFSEIFPEKFQNKTNGVTPRRWLAFCNPELSALITETLGTDEWTLDMSLLRGLEKHAEDPDFQAKWRDVKFQKKQQLADYIEEVTGDKVPIDALFDIHIKRIHEYKRQYLNMLSVLHRYKQLKAMTPEERANAVPRVVVVGGKAASAYDMAKRIIRLVTAVGEKVNNDPDTKDLLRVYFLPDYNVSLAEKIIPGAELSQHISTAGTEASGTSNMKFQMNGCLIIGTMDGANIEIAEESGKENMFIFGVDEKEVPRLREERKNFKTDPRWDELMNDILSMDYLYFKDLVDSVNNMDKGNDWFLLANDFASYLDAQEEVDKVYKDQAEWTRRSIMYTAGSGKFNSDRTIRQYADEIWGVESTPMPADYS